MSIETSTLLWLFPVAFMLHDFEEMICFEPWLARHGDEVRDRLPGFLRARAGALLSKSTTQFAVSIGLIFGLVAFSTFLAVEAGIVQPFVVAAALFWAHGFMHLGQAIVMRRYVPVVITSALVVVPYGSVLFSRLLSEGVVDWPGLIVSVAVGAVLMIPFILVMHAVGDVIAKIVPRLVR
ncbi:MAG: HXXEE domain-containing protein [Anaerolineae bacterium]|nr:HXXEE domain-containing protein [Anaerolineae bacterium]